MFINELNFWIDVLTKINEMNSETLDDSLVDKCRICLGIEQEMNPLFEEVYEVQDENESMFISLADVLKSISFIELEENESEPKNVCGNCTITVLNFNNLVKIFQDTQEELKTLLISSQKDSMEEKKITPTVVENIVIESYNVECPDNENSVDSCIQEQIINSTVNSEITSFDGNNIRKNTKEDSEFFAIKVENLTVLNPDESLKTENNSEVISKKYSCNECGDVFLLKSGFSHHMFQKHNIYVPSENYDQYSSDVRIKLPGDCSDKVFKFVQKLPSLIGKTHRFHCQICKQGFEVSTDLKEHYKIHKTFKCEHCDAAFIKNSYLRDHLVCHSTDKKYVCNVCGKSFKYRNGLSVHKTIHINQRGHICEACGQGFNARTTLLTHMKLKHGINEKKFPCSECDLEFKVKSWLDKHYLRKHTKNRTKDFVCSVCGIAYLNKYTLTRHVNNKHLGIGKRFQCHVCDKSYTMRNKLMKHMHNKHNIVLS